MQDSGSETIYYVLLVLLDIFAVGVRLGWKTVYAVAWIGASLQKFVKHITTLTNEHMYYCDIFSTRSLI